MDTIDLYSAAVSVHGDGNLMVSPLSILYCSMMLYLGAGGTTKSNLDTSFNFDKVFYDDRAAALSAFSNGLSDFQNSTSNTDTNFLITRLVNEIFVSDRVSLKPEYQQSVNTLQSVAKTKDFVNRPDQSRQEINDEVARNTANTIKDLLPAGFVTPDTVLILVNTLYFKASWVHVFQEGSTEKAPFALLNGNSAQVDMMHQTDVYDYAEDDQLDVQSVELPFHSFDASMLILLPRKTTGIRNLEKALTAESLRKLGENKNSRRVNMSLPKFTYSTNFDLISMLKKVGVSDSFDPKTADFSAMVNGGLVVVSGGVHQTFINVDERVRKRQQQRLWDFLAPLALGQLKGRLYLRRIIRSSISSATTHRKPLCSSDEWSLSENAADLVKIWHTYVLQYHEVLVHPTYCL